MSESKIEQAVRIDDPIDHSFALIGALVGFAAVAIAGILILGTGGAALVIIGSLAVYGSGSLEKIAKNWRYTAGQVVQGSPNVFVGGRSRNAARAKDLVFCVHDHLKKIISGCETIYINCREAARVKESTWCDGALEAGCETVFYGGPSKQVESKRFSGELPELFWITREVIDWATLLAPTPDPTKFVKFWKVYDALSNIVTAGDKILGYSGMISQAQGDYETANKIAAIQDNPVYVYSMMAFGGVGQAKPFVGRGGGAVPPATRPPALPAPAPRPALPAPPRQLALPAPEPRLALPPPSGGTGSTGGGTPGG
ncbi:PAAR domain-containing protein [Polyangium sp. 15x6]|uniref:PAAR domain-containing protein n=1 Tax=Polyangium sp. 15x6 TaxID=3042687 RepID=UPI00249B3B7C|nr:PAAR domain-containing protein [Polyangium sp. 15x6]MDI3291217.1 PAAR domain-containing protein [Polyangium sp. 15x6]